MAYYDLKKKPSLTTKEGETEVLYVQAITAGTISSDEFLDLVSKRIGFRKGEIEGVLMSVFDTATDWINKGFCVEVGEFGFFTGKVKGNRMVAKKRISAPNPSASTMSIFVLPPPSRKR